MNLYHHYTDIVTLDNIISYSYTTNTEHTITVDIVTRILCT